ncbi:chromatin-remodeling complex ATPase-like protein [Vairimorpha necatrix]|uniref:Chromatin-remodeling complex ATPase-like protein n=1 Tax=Vairimorpha necatrix TaxID=6039 RepID=A0AAX4JDC2_9MICR
MSSISEISESSTDSTSSEEQVIRRRGRPKKWDAQIAKQPVRSNNVLYEAPLGYYYVQPQGNKVLYVNPLVQRGFYNTFNVPPSQALNINSMSNISFYQNIQSSNMFVQPKQYPKQVKPKREERYNYVPEKRTKRAAATTAISAGRRDDINNDDWEPEIEYEEEDAIEKLLKFDEETNSYLVKFRYKSYLHCDYVKKEEICKTKGGAIKVKRFVPPLEPFDPEFIKVDRVLHEDFRNGKIYIVKWKKLPYELSTEEYAEDLLKCEGFEEELKKYRDRKKIRVMRYGLDWRPPRELQVKFEESPVYKGNNKLRAYQLEGLNWLLNRWYHKISCIMADEMGLGKTVQSVVFVNSLFTKFEYNGPVLIVAPLSTLVHWEREFLAWTDLRVLIYHGSIQGRSMIAEYEFFIKGGSNKVGLFDIMITTYEMVMAGFDHISQFNWSAGIFDEAHRLKNASSKAASTLRNINFNHKVLLSGTPLQNNISELWALLNFINPVEYNDSARFLASHKLEDIADVEKLQALLRPLMLRRMKEDVEKTIPMKEETIVEVELTMIQKRYYRAILEKNLDFLTKGHKDSAPNLLNAMMELRKCCIHPYLINGAEEKIIGDFLKRKKKENVESPVVETGDLSDLNIPVISNTQKIVIGNDLITDIDEYYKILIQSSGKLVLLDKLLNKLYGHHKVLIFSQMTKCLDLLSEYLAYKKYKFERIDGGVRGDHRQAAIDRFSDVNSDGFVFLLCTRAGGVGINLTAADTVIIFDSDWNPQNDLQAQARCHRIGQTNEVKIYRLVTRNTYEREMFDKAGMKLGLDRAILQKMTFEGQKNEKVKKKDAIEMLLRKGAYGVLMETDEASKKFCEEDIDQILERRTKVIKHSDGGNAFSKASFQVDEEIDDPFFWENLLSKKRNEENEGRVKRQMRRIARDETLNEEQIKDVEKYSNLRLENEEEFSEFLILKIFIICLADGLGPLGLSFNGPNLELKKSMTANLLLKDNLSHNLGPKDLEDLKNKDILLHFKYLVKYLVDQIINQKLRSDFSYCLDQVLDENYDPSLFDKYKDFYTKYNEKCLLRIQILFLTNLLLQTETINVEKTRGWSLEDDKKLVECLFTNGYGKYPEKIKNKSDDECNQRLRKIISTLNRMREMAEADSVNYKAIMKFGRVTEHNEDNVLKYLGDRDLNSLRENITNILNTTRRTRSQSDTECYERIMFFDRLSEVGDISNIRKVNLPRGWTKEKDSMLKEHLLEKGLVNVEEEFGMTEEACIKRCETIIKSLKEKSVEE